MVHVVWLVVGPGGRAEESQERSGTPRPPIPSVSSGWRRWGHACTDRSKSGRAAVVAPCAADPYCFSGGHERAPQRGAQHPRCCPFFPHGFAHRAVGSGSRNGGRGGTRPSPAPRWGWVRDAPPPATATSVWPCRLFARRTASGAPRGVGSQPRHGRRFPDRPAFLAVFRHVPRTVPPPGPAGAGPTRPMPVPPRRVPGDTSRNTQILGVGGPPSPCGDCFSRGMHGARRPQTRIHEWLECPARKHKRGAHGLEARETGMAGIHGGLPRDLASQCEKKHVEEPSTTKEK